MEWSGGEGVRRLGTTEQFLIRVPMEVAAEATRGLARRTGC